MIGVNAFYFSSSQVVSRLYRCFEPTKRNVLHNSTQSLRISLPSIPWNYSTSHVKHRTAYHNVQITYTYRITNFPTPIKPTTMNSTITASYSGTTANNLECLENFPALICTLLTSQNDPPSGFTSSFYFWASFASGILTALALLLLSLFYYPRDTPADEENQIAEEQENMEIRRKVSWGGG